MLKKRILTALVLFPFVLYAVFGLTQDVFEKVTAVVFLWGAWEWTYLMSMRFFASRVLYLVFLFFLMLIASSGQLSFLAIISVALLWWALVFIWILQYPKSEGIWSYKIILFLLGMQVFVPSWLALVLLHSLPHGSFLIMYFFFLVWGADTGAYTVGKLWGRRKLSKKNTNCQKKIRKRTCQHYQDPFP